MAARLGPTDRYFTGWGDAPVRQGDSYKAPAVTVGAVSGNAGGNFP